MYLAIKLFGKTLLAVGIYSQNISMESGTEKYANYEKQITTNDERNRTTNQENIRTLEKKKKKRKLQILGNIASGHHQTCGDEIKNKKRGS